MSKLVDWVIKKLGGVPRDSYDYVARDLIAAKREVIGLKRELKAVRDKFELDRKKEVEFICANHSRFLRETVNSLKQSVLSHVLENNYRVRLGHVIKKDRDEIIVDAPVYIVAPVTVNVLIATEVIVAPWVDVVVTDEGGWKSVKPA